MNWDEKATKAAVKNRHDLYEEDEDGYEFWGFSSQSDAQDHGFEEGTKWQRDQLRTDEAVERVAGWLCEDDHGYTLAGHGEWCQDLACDLVESYRESARDLITALIGEEP